jgi:DNA-binding YbaB/EbfC family protein
MTDGFDLGALLDSANQMQQQLAAAQQAAAETVVEGQAGGGVVKVWVTGAFEFKEVEIAPEVIDPSDREMLQDLVLAALHDAVGQVGTMQQQMMGGFDPGSVDLGSLLGAPADDDDDDDDDDEDDDDDDDDDDD